LVSSPINTLASALVTCSRAILAVWLTPPIFIFRQNKKPSSLVSDEGIEAKIIGINVVLVLFWSLQFSLFF